MTTVFVGPRVEGLETRLVLTAPHPVDLSALTGTNGFQINGIAMDDQSGLSVSNAGDVNGDGFDDIVIGAFHADPGSTTDAGQSYVVFGKSSGFTTPLELSTLDGTNGFQINGVSEFDNSGISVSSAGDVNGDGVVDLIIGAHRADPNSTSNAGASYVVFGNSSGFTTPLNLSTLNGTNGFRINGNGAEDRSGRSVSSAGDVNGDGFSDLLIGAIQADPNSTSNAGESYVVFGKSASFGASLDLSTLNGTNGFQLNGIGVDDNSGMSVSSAGDVNGDGFADLLIGAFQVDPSPTTSNAGESYVVFGKSGGFSSSLNLSALNGTNGFRIAGVDLGDSLGRSVSSAGDVNGDGFDDLLIGAFGVDPHAYSLAGASYVVFGKSSSFGTALDLLTLNGTNGFRINGIEASDYSGFSVSNAGDVNGDGFDDLLIGAYGADPNTDTAAGSSYVVFGKSSGFPGALELSALDGTNGFRLDGIDANDDSGFSVSNAGDVNGDGFADLLIGAFGGDPNSVTGAGESYVVFGGNFTGGTETQVGTSGANMLTAAQGAAAIDVLIGQQGSDTLVSDGGADVLYGGEGSDTLAIVSTAFQRVAGGSGSDTLRLDGSGLTLNLTTIADNKLTDIEVIDITGSGDNTLALNQLEVLNLSSISNTLLVRRNDGDTVTIGSGWTQGTDEIIGADTFEVYTQGAATLKVQVVAPSYTLTATIDGGDLVIEDTDSTGKNNLLSVSRDGADNIVITDASEAFTTSISGATLSTHDRTITIPASALTGTIIFKTLGGGDSLSVDVSTDLGFDVDYQGGSGTSDSLTLAAATVTSVTHTFTNANSGSVSIDNSGTRVITYSGLEPITDNLIADDRFFELPSGGAAASLEDDATAGNGVSRLRSTNSTFEQVTFANPVLSLTIDGGSGSDTITVAPLDSQFDAELILDGQSGTDTINLNAGTLTLASPNSLSATAETVNVQQIALTTTGPGVVTLTGDVITIDTTLSSITTAEAGAVTLKPQSNATPINLGTASSSSFGLSDAQLDRISTGTLTVGTTNLAASSATVSNAITRMDGKTLIVATGPGRDINFGSTGSIDVASGHLVLVTTGSGAIKSGGATLDAVAGTLTLSAGEGTETNNGAGIGASDNPFAFNATTLQASVRPLSKSFLSEADSVSVISMAPYSLGLSAQNGTINLVNGTFTATSANLINDTSALTVLSTASYNQNDFDDGGINGLSLESGTSSGASVLTGTGKMTLTSNVALTTSGTGATGGSISGKLDLGSDTRTFTIANGAASSDLTVSAVVSGSPGSGLTKLGLGTLTLSGANTFTGATTITGGTLLVNGSTVAASAVTVQTTSTLGGTGTVGGTVAVESGGTVSPGTSPGLLTVGSTTFASGSTFAVEVNGSATAGMDYDQLKVLGTINLGGATLSTSGTISSAAGQQIVIIDNNDNDSVMNTFAGLPEGATVTINSIPFKITYVGGTGNDVVLSQTEVSVSVSPTSVNENGSSNLEYTFTRVGAIGAALTVSFNVGGTAVFANDYTQTGAASFGVSSGTVTFLAGSSTAIVTIDPTGDSTVELDETAALTVTTGTGYEVGSPSLASGTIANDDTAIFLIDDMMVSESAGTLTFTVSLSNPIDTTATVNVSYSGGTATGGGTDYDSTTDQVTFAANTTMSQTVTVAITNGNVVEATETFLASLALDASTSLTGYSTSLSDTGTGTITDDNTATFLIDDVTVNESAGTLTFTISLSNPIDTIAKVNVSYGGGSATGSGTDYDSTTDQVTFAANSTTSQIVTVAITNDDVVEATENFTASLALDGTTSLTGYSKSLSDTGTGEISDTDTATVSIANFANGAETATPTNGAFRVTQTAASSSNTVVTYTVSNSSTATADSDYTMLTGSVTIFAGDTTADITVAVLNDATVEGTETVIVTLTGFTSVDPDITLSSVPANLTATVNITDTDTATVSVAKFADGAETATPTNGAFRVTQIAVSSSNTVVTYTVSNSSTATADSDYTMLTGSVTIMAGSTTADITVAVLNDAMVEGTETVIITLTGFSSGDPDITLDTNPANLSATVNISDVTTVSIAKFGDGAESAPPTNGTFRVTQTASSSINTVVTYTVSNSSTAAANSDYTMLTGSVTIFAGDTTADINVAVLNDAMVEGTESVIVTLTGFSSGDPDITLDTNPANLTATVNITDNDAATVSIAQFADGAESAVPTNGTFRVTQTAVSSSNTVVTYTVSNSSTATAGSDYTMLTGSVTIIAGNTTADINVAVLNDVIVEGTETVIVTLTGFSSVDPDITLSSVPANLTATVNITDNDTATVSVANFADGAETATPTNGAFRVTQTAVSSSNTVVTYTVSNSSTATADSDYTMLTGSVTIFAGNTTADINVAVLNDGIVEATETVIVTLTGFTSVDPDITLSSVPANVTATVNITDSDTATISISSPSVTEVNSGTATLTFTVSLDNPVDTIVTMSANTADGTTNPATATSDYIAVSGATVSFAANSTTAQTVNVTVNGDTTVELNETLKLVLSALSAGGRSVSFSGSGSTLTGIGTINNDDNLVVEFSQASVIEAESLGGNLPKLLVTGTVQAGQSVTINVAVDGSSTATGGGVDFVTPTTLTVTAGTYSATAFAIPSLAIITDGMPEPNETIVLNGISGSAVTVGDADGVGGTQSSTTYTITDQPRLVISDASLTEGNSGTTLMTFTVTLDNAATSGFTVDYSIQDEIATVANNDYVPTAAGRLRIGTFNATRGGEFSLSNGSSAATMRSMIQTNFPAATITGTSDLTTPGFLANIDVLWLNSVFTNTTGIAPLSLAEQTAMLNFVKAGGRAIIFGENSFFDDSTLLAPFGAVTTGTLVGLQEGLVTNHTDVLTNGPFGVVSVLQGNYPGMLEPLAAATRLAAWGNGGTSVQVLQTDALSSGSGLVLLLSDVNFYADQLGVADNPKLLLNTLSAVRTAAPHLTFVGTAGESHTLTVTINGDIANEADETLHVLLSNVVGNAEVTILDGDGLGVIVNDDANGAPPVITSNGGGVTANLSVAENTTAVLTTVTATDATVGDMLTFAITGGPDATKFTINNPASGNVKFLAAPDFENPTDADHNNVYQLLVSAIDVIGNVDTQLVSVTVTDVQSTLSINDITQTEGNSGSSNLTFAVTLGSAVAPFSVRYSTQDGTATVSNNDYVGTSPGVLRIGAFDGSRGGLFSLSNGSNAAAMKTLIQSSFPGATITGTSTLTPAFLSTVDVVWLNSVSGNTSATAALTGAEQAALLAFVQGGGHALLFGENGAFDDESLLDPFNATTTGTLTDQQTGTITNTTHPLTAATAPFGAVTTLQGFFPGNLSELGSATALGKWNSTNGTNVAVLDPGVISASSGRVVLLADVNFYADQLNSADNKKLLLNALASMIPASSVTLSFAGTANETQLIPVSVKGDATVEGDETFRVLLGQLSGTNDVTIVKGTGLGTILNDDGGANRPVITSDGGGVTGMKSVTENSTTVTTVTATDTDLPADTLTYSISGGADAAKFAIVPTTGVLTFKSAPDFENSSDSDHNNVYQVTVTVTDSIGQFDSQALSVTVTDVQATLSIGNAQATEGSPLSFPVTLSNAIGTGFKVNYASQDGTGPSAATVAGQDYVPVTTGTLRIGAFDGTRGGIYSLSNGSSVAAMRTLITSSFTGATFLGTSTLTSAFLSTVDVVWLNSVSSNTSATAALSVAEQNALLAFVQNGGHAMIFGENSAFDDESLLDKFNATSTGTLSDIQAGTITDPSLTNPLTHGAFGTVATLQGFFSGSFNSSNGGLGLATQLATWNSGGPTSVAVAVIEPRGVLGSNSGRVVLFSDVNFYSDQLNAADNSKLLLNALATMLPPAPLAFTGTQSMPEVLTIPVTTKTDAISESDETLNVLLGTLSGTNDVTISQGTGQGTILEAVGTQHNVSGVLENSVSVMINDVLLREGNSGSFKAVFTVQLSEASDETVTVSYATTNPSDMALGAATPGVDYTTASGTLTFAPGQTTKTFTILVKGDQLAETTESFAVHFESSANADLVRNTAQVTIVDNDPVPSLSINSVSVKEGTGNGTDALFTVKLSKASGAPVTVHYASLNGTAVAGSDFDHSSGTLTFAPGQTTQTIKVHVTGDSLSEANETFQMLLSDAANAAIRTSTGTGTIKNDDKSPSLSIGDVTVVEGNIAVFTVVLSAPSGQDVTVKYATANGSAKAQQDYTAASGTLTFAAGETTKTISVNVGSTIVGNASKQFAVNLSAPLNALFADRNALATILDGN